MIQGDPVLLYDREPVTQGDLQLSGHRGVYCLWSTRPAVQGTCNSGRPAVIRSQRCLLSMIHPSCCHREPVTHRGVYRETCSYQVTEVFTVYDPPVLLSQGTCNSGRPAVIRSQRCLLSMIHPSCCHREPVTQGDLQYQVTEVFTVYDPPILLSQGTCNSGRPAVIRSQRCLLSMIHPSCCYREPVTRGDLQLSGHRGVYCLWSTRPAVTGNL